MPSRMPRRSPALLLLLTGACATADLRPEGGTFPASAEAEGRAWLVKAAEAQGGAALGAHRAISMWMRDEWPGWLARAVAFPWPENGQLLRVDARVGTDDGRITFVGGPEADSGWGIQQWVTYRFDAAGKLDFDPVDDPDDDIKFWIPTTMYFPFMVWRLQEADVVRAMGPQTIGERTYQRVFVSWGRAEPQDEIDQYVVYIDEQTHLLRWARYTVRDVAGFAVGLMRYEDYREVGDLKLPYTLRVVPEFEAKETGLHRFEVDKVELDPPLAEDWLLPRPDLRANK